MIRWQRGAPFRVTEQETPRVRQMGEGEAEIDGPVQAGEGGGIGDGE